MVKVTDKIAQGRGKFLFICDFSPPRGSAPELLASANDLDADWISVAYNPGKSTRLNSAMAAHWIKSRLNKDVVFTLATRDMNKLAIQSVLLGADLLGLENVVIVKGDEFTERDLSRVQNVDDYSPTSLMESLRHMNEGVDFKDLKLRNSTNFCIGATIDLSRGVEQEVKLSRRKVEAGAQFFISQPTFDPGGPQAFIERYRSSFDQEFPCPIFYGVQVMTEDSLVFGDVPEWVTEDLKKERSGIDIALQVLDDFSNAGLRSIYLIPPIMRGGRRDYEAAKSVLANFRK